MVRVMGWAGSDSQRYRSSVFQSLSSQKQVGLTREGIDSSGPWSAGDGTTTLQALSSHEHSFFLELHCRICSCVLLSVPGQKHHPKICTFPQNISLVDCEFGKREAC